MHKESGREGGEEGEGDGNRQVELFYRYGGGGWGPGPGTVTCRIIETHGQWPSEAEADPQ